MSSQPIQPSDNKVYVFQLEAIVRRCFEEGKKAGWIQVSKVGNVGESFVAGQPIFKDGLVLVNEWELSKHIAKTVIGELHELELIRRLSPIFRAVIQLSQEFQEIDAQVAAESRRLNLRKDPEV